MTFPRTAQSRIPDAVAAVVAAVVAEYPRAGPDAIGRLTVAELSREGWHWHLGHEPLCAPVSASRTPDRTSTPPAPCTPAVREGAPAVAHVTITRPAPSESRPTGTSS